MIFKCNAALYSPTSASKESALTQLTSYCKIQRLDTAYLFLPDARRPLSTRDILPDNAGRCHHQFSSLLLVANIVVLIH